MGIAWEERLATGIETVDEQHRELFCRINAFLDACDNNRGKAELIGLLQFLDDYVTLHFRNEELLQLEGNYHDRQLHQGYHRWFAENLTDLKRRFLMEGPHEELMKEINRLVVGWLLDHIAEKDRDFGRSFTNGAP